MELNFFQYLPSEITSNILSRLPIRSLAVSKSVCKPWLNLIDSDYFHKSEIKTPPALILLTEKTMDSTWCAVFEIEDEDEKSHDFHHIPLMDLEIPHGNRGIMGGITANGLLLLYPGTWRRVEAGAASGFVFHDQSIECNGNIHWRVFDLCGDMWICGFDVETESFRIFSIPPVGDGYRDWYLCVLRDCLCYCYPHENEIVIWMMKEYQVEDSWTIEYKLSTMFDINFNLDHLYVHLIKHFKDGDILMMLDEYDLIYYSNKTRTLQQVGMFRDGSAGLIRPLIFTPSLISLKNFGFENVISF
ncbi:F-box protein At3g07870-like isoform X2 [Salvia hispanica]|uniref:F-box protein At3g07870-like isoform X2 n=1 Tax=Salvia hispanica TaxID=49212 RepID=UPI002009B760|nr:F-box protein At3g07870-like isoform X2 [Salvia hispanica]